MRIDVHVDRQPHMRKPDPVAGREGVFAHLEDDEFSEAEHKRSDMEAKRDARAKGRGVRNWLPQDIQKYLTKIYGRFSKPNGWG